MSGGTEHIVELNHVMVATLREWLNRPNGACPMGRVNFEAVEGGGIRIRTEPYGKRAMPGLAGIVVQALTGTSEDGVRRADGLKVGNKDDVDEAMIEAIVARRLNQVARLVHEAIHT